MTVAAATPSPQGSVLAELLADTPLAGARPQGEDADGAAPADVGGAAGHAADADARVLGVVGRAFAPGSGQGRRATLPAWLAVGGGGAPVDTQKTR